MPDGFRDAARCRPVDPLAGSVARGRAAPARSEDGRGRRLHPRQSLRPYRAGSETRRGSASWRPERPISICAVRSPISGYHGCRRAGDLGLRIYKVGADLAARAERRARFAEGLRDVLVVEEKRGLIEDQLVRASSTTWISSKRPPVVGKRDESGAPRLLSEGELTPTMVARAPWSRRLRKLATAARCWSSGSQNSRRSTVRAEGTGAGSWRARRIFCSGCPHNTSTKDLEGSRAMAGIGCHGMALSDAEPPDTRNDLRIWARRACQLDRAGALHRRTACVPDPRRRHLHPFWPVGACAAPLAVRTDHFTSSSTTTRLR